jgi:hypothetical protein
MSGMNRGIAHAMEIEYRVRRGAKAETKRLGSAIATVATRSTGSTLIYCSTCSAPVVDSLQGRAAHAERMPQCKRVLWSADR